MNRERLFARLGQMAYATLVEATSLGGARQHAIIDLDHWMACLLKRERSDLVLLMSDLGIDVGHVERRLEAALHRVNPSGDSFRDISAVLERSVAPAITWSQVAAPSAKVRSGHLLLAWLEDPATFRWLKDIDPRGLQGITLDRVLERFEALAGGWPEAGQVEGNFPAERPSALPSSEPQAALARWGTCLTEQAERGELDPVVGRGEELRAVIDVLLRRRQNNPILVGEAGVGKTAIVEGLAQRIHAGAVPESLAGAKVWALDVSRMQAGAGVRGEFEQRLRSVIDAVVSSTAPIILFCDEAHTLVGAGGPAGTGDAVNLIKPMLARGQLRMVAATTWTEYKQHIEPDLALVRRFQTVPVEEPSDSGALEMLRMIAPRFARHHGVEIADAALSAAVMLSRRYLPARQLPDKAISLLDTACARVSMSRGCAPAELDRLTQEVESVEQALRWQANDRRLGLRAPDLASLSARRARLESEATTLAHAVAAERHAVNSWLARWQEGRDRPESVEGWPGERPSWVLPWVDEQMISQVLSEWTGVPCAQLAQDDAGRLMQLQAALQEQIVGQSGALASLARAVQVSRAGLGEPDRPLGVMVLAGPTGTGKSQTAVALARLLFGGERQLIQFNMNEFQEPHTVSTLRGSPPGYVGFGKGGRLTEAVRQKPYSVLLLDEFDRAHPDVHEIFYQAFDQGWMEDGEGRRASFRNCLILLTTNVGDAAIAAALAGDAGISQARLDAVARASLQGRFSPALLGRMQVLAYRPLGTDALAGIALRALEELGDRLRAESIGWSFEDEAPAWIAAAVAQHPASGRAVRDLLRQQVVPRIAQGVLAARAAGQPLRAVKLRVDRGLALCFEDVESGSIDEPLAPLAPDTPQEEATCA